MHSPETWTLTQEHEAANKSQRCKAFVTAVKTSRGRWQIQWRKCTSCDAFHNADHVLKEAFSLDVDPCMVPGSPHLSSATCNYNWRSLRTRSSSGNKTFSSNHDSLWWQVSKTNHNLSAAAGGTTILASTTPPRGFKKLASVTGSSGQAVKHPYKVLQSCQPGLHPLETVETHKSRVIC